MREFLIRQFQNDGVRAANIIADIMEVLVGSFDEEDLFDMLLECAFTKEEIKTIIENVDM